MRSAVASRLIENLVPQQEAPCIVCGEHDWRPHFRILRRCERCGFVRASEFLTEDDIAALYQEDYFRGKEYGDYLGEQVVHRTNFAHRLQDVLELTGGLESVFEIGCAYGLWLETVAARGIRCAGIDVCEPAIDHARANGLEAWHGDFTQLELLPGEYAAYCMWDTIEHLTHPDAYLARIRDLLPKKGWLFLTTGDLGSKMAQRRGPRWRMIHPPTHLQYFSRPTLTRLLERHGFEVVRVRSVPMYRNIRSVLTGMLALGKGLPRRAAWLAERVLPRFCQEKIGFWLDLGDIMFVAARCG